MKTFHNSFNGADYQPVRDDVRLSGQILRVYSYMSDSKWHTLREIAEATGDPESSVSAQLRHLRKQRFGSHEIEKVYISNGLYKYKLKKEEIKNAN